MPGYKGHLVGGAVAFSCLILITKYWQQPSLFLAIQYFFFTLLGSLFPDIDTKSRGQGIFYRILLIVLGVLIFRRNIQVCLILSLVSLTPLLVRHRGLFHKIWFIIITPFSIAFLASYASHLSLGAYSMQALFFVVGALSHIVLDKLI